METCYFSEFVDIADLTLHGDTECITLAILPYQETPAENYEEVRLIIRLDHPIYYSHLWFI